MISLTGTTGMQPVRYRNSVLKALDADSIDRLKLRKVKFEIGHEIEFPGSPINHVFFIEEGMASVTVTFEDGSQVEVGMFGCESVIGLSAFMGTHRSLNRVYTQIAGWGYSSAIDLARREFTLGGHFFRMALRIVQAQLVTSMQSCACNAKHSVDQRLARWLLICADRANSSSFRMPHEYIATMLGVTRPSVSTAARLLKQAGLILYSREVIRIPERAQLEAKACECFRVIHDHLDNTSEFDTGLAE